MGVCDFSDAIYSRNNEGTCLEIPPESYVPILDNDILVEDIIGPEPNKDDDFYFLEWVLFDDRFTDIKQIGEGGFSKVYSATWLDGKSDYSKLDDGSWKKLARKPIKVALKRLNGSQSMSADYLTEVFKLYYFCPII
jgi:serine/threonine protein kinase